eukprot:scaffold25422_cov187-Amphora_coffeaeformis.AAC.4
MNNVPQGPSTLTEKRDLTDKKSMKKTSTAFANTNVITCRTPIKRSHHEADAVFGSINSPSLFTCPPSALVALGCKSTFPVGGLSAK